MSKLLDSENSNGEESQLDLTLRPETLSEYFVDGGTLNNFPVDLIAPKCEKVIGVYVNPFEKLNIKDLKHSYNVLERAYRIKTAYDSIVKFKDCDILICPKELKEIGTFSLRDIDEVFELGYEAANAELMKVNVSDLRDC